MSWADFKDFDLDFTLSWANVIEEGNDSYVDGVTDGVPTLTTTKPASYMACISGMKYKDNEYGVYAGEIKVPVISGKYEIGLGITDYGGEIYVYADEKQVAVINSKSTNGDKFFNDKTKIATGQFNVESDCELSIATSEDKLGNVYYPFFSIKRIGNYELPSNVKVTYYDTDGKTIGTETVSESSTLNFKYNESDVTVPLGYKFRGWFKSTDEYAEKVGESYKVDGNLQLYAKATLIEAPTLASSYTFDLTQKNWYPEDHEAIKFSSSNSSNTKPYWHDKQHGWAFKNGDAVKIKVAGKAVITVDRCCYGGKTTLTLTNGSKKIGTATAPAGNDGEPATFEYSGGEATLTLKIETENGKETYIHGISVKHNGSAEFEPFKINFRRNPYSFVAPTSHAPANVKVISGKWHDEGVSTDYNTLGYKRALVRVNVDRPVKFTIGTSNDTDNAAVSINGGPATVIKTNFRAEGGICDDDPDTYNHNVKYVYEGTEPALLVFDLGEFCPYFFAEELVAPEYDEATKTFNVAEGNVEQLRNAIIKANTMGGNTTIYLPNGTYDLSSDINTEIKGDNIAIVGESRDGVIIKNSPTVQGLDRTATLKNTSTGLYLQNLTLQCDAKYDENEKSEVGIALWDKGTKTICKNVCLKGRQGTYYSNGAEGMIAYFEGGKIEGAVDFICGSGNVLFNSVTLNVIATEHTQSGGCIAALSTYSSENGYVFANCLVTAAGSQKNTYYLARGWQNSPAALFVLTKFAVDPSPEYWGRNIADLDSRRFAAHGTGAAYDADATSITKASLVNFASNWDPAFIISLHSPIKTNAAGWASYTAFTDVYLKGEDVKAYTAIQINKNSVLLKTIDDKVIPAGTAVFVKGAEETAYNVNGAVVGKAIGENYLKPVLFDTPLTSGQNAFVIGTRDGVCGLYLVNSDIVVPAGKCYLDAGEASLVFAKDELDIVFYDSEATGINNIDADTDADSFRYNLSGQKVGNGYKGIVVRKDGKKYMAK